MPEDIEMLDFEAFKERYENVPVEEYPNNVREAVPDPVVSVHLLTYNHADYIEEAIESVLMQEVDFPMEIVLGDDDSSDGTREICIEYAKQYPDLIRLQLHHRENNIRLYERPTHLFQYWYNTLSARGKYIAVLSGDDYWTDPLKLQKQCVFLECHDEFALSFHDAYVIDEVGEVIDSSKIPNKNKRNLKKEELVAGAYLPALSLFVRNSFDSISESLITCLNEDAVTISIAGLVGKGKYQENVGLAAYRVRDQSLWSSESPLQKAVATKHTVMQIASVHKKINNKLTQKIIGSCISLVARLATSKRILFASKELFYTVKLLFRKRKYREVLILMKGLFRFLLGRIKRQVLSD